MMYYPWNTENIARLNELWKLGWSCGVIADDMGGGLTRNAVIGKITRLGLTRSVASTRTNRVRGVGSKGGRGLHRPRPKPPERPQVLAERLAPPPRKLEPVSRQLSLLELTNRTCKWPYGDQPPFKFCGATSLEGMSWCSFHAARCFNSRTQKDIDMMAAKAMRSSHGMESQVLLHGEGRAG